jgi:oxygen-dependent protoporphyrinogen oxidase
MPVGAALDAEADVSVGLLVRRRMGRAIQLGLVDPLLGGINAAHTDELSAAVSAPQLLAAARRQRSLIRGLRSAAPAGAELAPGSVFLTIRGGLQRLVDAISAGIRQAPGGEVVLDDEAQRVIRTPSGWEVALDSGRVIECGAIVVACPPAGAAHLLDPVSPGAAGPLRSIPMASVAMTLLAYRADALSRPLSGSGFLVPRTDGRLLTAASWVGSKWPHLAVPDTFVVRASAGRVDDERPGAMDDGDLVAALHGELASAMGLRDRPVETTVHRWDGAFPQFRVGHLERIADAERHLAVDAPGLALAGAALRGVGLATCVAGARDAAARARSGVLSHG